MSDPRVSRRCGVLAPGWWRAQFGAVAARRALVGPVAARRAGIGAVAVILGCAAGLSAPGAAAGDSTVVSATGDSTVVSATIYPGSAGTVSTRAATLAQLMQCPPFTGPDPMVLNPSQQPFQWPSGLTWSLDEVLQCGLGIAPGSLTAVQVLTPAHGYEAPLTAADIARGPEYQEPGALPVISAEPDGDLNSYFRPWRGGGDANQADYVTDTGPLPLAVYTGQPPLAVSLSQHTVKRGAGAISVAFTAAVSDAAGNPVALSSLSLRWDFGDGGQATGPAPTHGFTQAGVYYATVTVTGAGTGGTATIPVTIGTPPRGPVRSGTTGHHRTGTTGQHRTGAAGHRQTGGTTGHHETHGAAGKGTITQAATTTTATRTSTTQATTPQVATTQATTTPQATTTQATTTQTSTATSPAPASTPPAPPSPRPPAPHRARAPRATGRLAGPVSAPLVSGRLIGEITPGGPGSLMHDAAAHTPAQPQARATAAGDTGDGSWATAPAAAGAVLCLFGLGVARELRGRRRSALGA